MKTTIQLCFFFIRFSIWVKWFSIYIIQFKNCWNSIQIRHHVLGVTFQAFKLARGSRIPNMFIQIGVEVKRVFVDFVVCVLISHYPQFYPHQRKWHAYYVIVVCLTPGGGGGSYHVYFHV